VASLQRQLELCPERARSRSGVQPVVLGHVAPARATQLPLRGVHARPLPRKHLFSHTRPTELTQQRSLANLWIELETGPDHLPVVRCVAPRSPAPRHAWRAHGARLTWPWAWAGDQNGVFLWLSVPRGSNAGGLVSPAGPGAPAVLRTAPTEPRAGGRAGRAADAAAADPRHRTCPAHRQCPPPHLGCQCRAACAVRPLPRALCCTILLTLCARPAGLRASPQTAVGVDGPGADGQAAAAARRRLMLHTAPATKEHGRTRVLTDMAHLLDQVPSARRACGECGGSARTGLGGWGQMNCALELDRALAAPPAALAAPALRGWRTSVLWHGLIDVVVVLGLLAHVAIEVRTLQAWHGRLKTCSRVGLSLSASVCMSVCVRALSLSLSPCVCGFHP
jgi:hypothetical protein